MKLNNLLHAFLIKPCARIVNKLYAEYEARKLVKANAFLTGLSISKFAGLLGGLAPIESSTELDKELQKDQLLKSDVELIVRQVIYHTSVYYPE